MEPYAYIFVDLSDVEEQLSCLKKKENDSANKLKQLEKQSQSAGEESERLRSDLHTARIQADKSNVETAQMQRSVQDKIHKVRRG